MSEESGLRGHAGKDTGPRQPILDSSLPCGLSHGGPCWGPAGILVGSCGARLREHDPPRCLKLLMLLLLHWSELEARLSAPGQAVQDVKQISWRRKKDPASDKFSQGLSPQKGHSGVHELIQSEAQQFSHAILYWATGRQCNWKHRVTVLHQGTWGNWSPWHVSWFLLAGLCPRHVQAATGLTVVPGLIQYQ